MSTDLKEVKRKREKQDLQHEMEIERAAYTATEGNEEEES